MDIKPAHLNICDLPPQILKAAQTLSSYFDSQGIHRWEIDNVCSRRILWGVQSTLQKKYREFMRRAGADDNSAYIALAKAEEIRELAAEMGFEIEPKIKEFDSEKLVRDEAIKWTKSLFGESFVEVLVREDQAQEMGLPDDPKWKRVLW